ncbi:ATP-binding protein [Clostridium cochlearium]|uniref:histidine kinase n=1 Tax=Clostridium cochlearium TaxID=1494 RepID=A0A240A800_CLOCO|nr:sensor histidine kinase [Clostridium cochlearium]MBV1817001.1 sensor histidine kinase [Bacteroidales bacterium MSK.15.36]MBU5268960.1 sensor histidine kinase [Clostridium cochlearium]MCG4570753.1 sensor histidine kinase [Clostridium cochlearium]MCG4579536.1 sensor histidine kinase [Clostridium cochlearium]NMA58694.1 sensor histidine kinase [Clostridium cochlearium]
MKSKLRDKVTLKIKITLYVFTILVTVISIIGYLSFKEMKNLIEKERSKEVLRLAQTLAMTDEIKRNLNKKDSLALQYYVERVRLKTNVTFIVVIDMEGIRYSHPIEENIGKIIKGGDHVEVINSGESYVSEAEGTLGVSIRGFAPVYKDGEQIGAVSVGILKGNVNLEVYNNLSKFIPFILLGLITGILGAYLLAYSIKDSIYGLEPKEIALLLSLKDAILESVEDGIIAVDKSGNILNYNKSAEKLLGINNKDLGKSVLNYMSDESILEVLKTKEPLMNVENKIKNGTTLMCNYSILEDKEENFMGLVITFEDLTRIKELAEELTGAKKILWSLRAQNHEFMNKLHTISGLIQIEEYDMVVDYISELAYKRGEISELINENIKIVPLQGLLLAKYNKCEEEKINFIIKESSSLEKLPIKMNSEEICSIVGNLIDNSIDAVKVDGTGKIEIEIRNDDKELFLMVKDNGVGISKEIDDKIYLKDTSTKPGSRGLGMYIVKNIIEDKFGNIQFISNKCGTTWFINIPMKGNSTYDKCNDN